jgi:hypothetical protein
MRSVVFYTPLEEKNGGDWKIVVCVAKRAAKSQPLVCGASRRPAINLIFCASATAIGHETAIIFQPKRR